MRDAIREHNDRVREKKEDQRRRVYFDPSDPDDSPTNSSETAVQRIYEALLENDHDGAADELAAQAPDLGKNLERKAKALRAEHLADGVGA